MERRELLKIVASLGAAGVAGRFVTACASTPSSPATGSPSSTSTTSVTPTGTAGSVPAGTAVRAAKGYGALGSPDANGLRLPAGFTSRIIATSGQPVAGTGYVWHDNPDGGACFAADGGGWIYVSNSESGPDVGGGVSMVRFATDGSIVEARRILGNTARNCAGGATPWNTWLSCEEIPQGKVHECFPLEGRDPVARPALGVFNHEAVAVHEATKTLYLTEDQPDGALYRFRPANYPDLAAGTLEVLTESGGDLAWIAVPDPSAASAETRTQVPGTKRFSGGEGICVFDDLVFFTTKGDNRVTRYDPGTDTLTMIYDGAGPGSVLQGVDNITAGSTGDLFVAEDGGDMQLVQLFGTTVAAVAQVVGADGSEITGPAFSPDGTRLYFSSQRLPGVTYEVSGPWAG